MTEYRTRGLVDLEGIGFRRATFVEVLLYIVDNTAAYCLYFVDAFLLFLPRKPRIGRCSVCDKLRASVLDLRRYIH